MNDEQKHYLLKILTGNNTSTNEVKPQKKQLPPLKESCINFFRDPNWNWRWALTLTFKDQSISQEQADKKLKKFVMMINRRFYGCNAWKKDNAPQVNVLAVRELNTSGGIHYHLAISEISNIRDDKRHIIRSINTLWGYFVGEWKDLGGGDQVTLDAIHNPAGWIRYIMKKIKTGDEIIYDYLVRQI
jgi:hypothetical protein